MEERCGSVIYFDETIGEKKNAKEAETLFRHYITEKKEYDRVNMEALAGPENICGWKTIE